MSDSRPKTRHLSTFEFFEVVQIEYLCAVLRARIYVRTKDKSYWNKVAAGKRQIIETIAARNTLPSIFTDSDLETALSERIYCENSHPNFCYKDEAQRTDQEYYDLLYYYNKGCDMRFDNDGDVMIGKVISYTPFDKKIKLKLQSSETTVEIAIDKVTRIL